MLCCLGFFLFMQSGELTLPAGTAFDLSQHLSPRNVAVDSWENPSMLRIHLKASKTDQTRVGIDLLVGHMLSEVSRRAPCSAGEMVLH